MLVVQRLSVRRGEFAVVQHATLRVENPGLLFVVGTGGAGKSSLLATLAGAGPRLGLAQAGTMELDGQPIAAADPRAAWVPQQACLEGGMPLAGALCTLLGRDHEACARWLDDVGLGELAGCLGQPVDALPRARRRELAVLAGLSRQATIHLVDEPTSGLDDAAQQRVRGRLREVAAGACVVVATHNRRDCLALGGLTALLAGGTIQECAPSERFFSQPATAAGRTYVETGNCNLPPEPRLGRTRDGVWWLVPGLLCGMSRPGLTARLAAQLQGLAGQGVRDLVCLEERVAYPVAAVREAGLRLHHLPVPDMAPPAFGPMVDLCRVLEPVIRANAGVAMHCRGGLGRTGTALAALLAWFGDDADAAVAKVRRANPLAIQTVAQARFVHEFADRIRGWHVSASLNQEMSNVVG